MCCRRRRNNRGPALVILGKMAYDKYQERKANRIEQQPDFGRKRSPSPELLEDQANAEILEKAGISPPSYNEVIVNRAHVPSARLDVSEKEIKGEKGFIDDLTALEDGYDVVDGMSSPNARRGPAQTVLPGYPETQLVYGQRPGSGASRCEQKRAEKMARKAEKQAAKLAKMQAMM